MNKECHAQSKRSGYVHEEPESEQGLDSRLLYKRTHHIEPLVKDSEQCYCIPVLFLRNLTKHLNSDVLLYRGSVLFEKERSEGR